MHCRLCLTNCCNADSLENFKYDKETSWQQLIQKYFPLKLEPNDLRTSTICEDCSRNLKDFHTFFLHVEQCQLLLQKEHRRSAKTIVKDCEPSVGIRIKTETESFDKEFLSNDEEIVDKNCETNDFIVKTEASDSECLNFAESLLKSEHYDISNEVGNEHVAIFEVDDVAENGQSNVKMEQSTNETNEFDYSSDDSIEDRAFASSSEEDEHTCIICGKTLKNFYGLLNHMPKYHKNMRPYHCEICDLSVRFKFELRRHMLVAHETHTPQTDNAEDQTCVLCNKILKSKRALSRHMQKKHRCIKPYVCLECGRKFTAKVLYDIHTLSHEGAKPRSSDLDEIEYRTCGVCGEIFGNINKLTGHLYKNHYGSKPHECEKCKQKFYLKQTLEHHKLKNCQSTRTASVSSDQNATEVERNTCHICRKKFDQFSRYYHHMSTTHNDLKRFKCQICGIKFKVKSQLEEHFRQHKKNVFKAFHCEKCNKTFDFEQSLDRHKLMNCQEAPLPWNKNSGGKQDYTCHICPQKFSQFSTFFQHISINHKSVKTIKQKSHVENQIHEGKPCESKANSAQNSTVLNDKVDDERKKCKICNRTFVHASSFQVHMSKAHCKPSKCERCGKSYKLEKSLKNHLLWCNAPKIKAIKQPISSFVSLGQKKLLPAPLLPHTTPASVQNSSVSNGQDTLERHENSRKLQTSSAGKIRIIY